jgi:hypothetical protein
MFLGLNGHGLSPFLITYDVFCLEEKSVLILFKFRSITELSMYHYLCQVNLSEPE